jgi:hypothetical protein
MTGKRIGLVALVAGALAALLTAASWASTTGGAGMMGARGSGSGMMGANALSGNGVQVRSLDGARQRAQAFADRWGLKAGEVMQFDNGFYVELLTSAGQGATEVLVDQGNGSVRIEYGPAMMWNTGYGMHAGWAGGSATVSAADAVVAAQAWLDRQRPGATAGEPEAFPGYFTLHATRDGKVVGMLSVNAFTGAVWYHTWHGTYVAMSEG